jgi:DNA primase
MDHCQKQGFSVELMEMAGLIRARPNKEGFYEWFRQRLIFPISDDQGRVIAFGGRTLSEGEPKYLNSPETVLFIKGHCLYTKPDKKNYETMVVVEGYFDVMAVSDVTKAVAPLGTALTADQLMKIWRHYKEPIICFDGDTAGDKAALRSALMALPLLTPGKSLSFVQLPPQEDPHSFIQQRGTESFKTLIKEPIPLSNYLWEKLFMNRKMTPEQKASAIDTWKQWVGSIQNFDIRKGYQDFFYTASRAHFQKRSSQQKEVIPLSPSIIIHQKILIGLLILYPDLKERVHEHVADMIFTEANPWLTLRDLMVSLYPESVTEEHVARCLGSQWRQIVTSVLVHVPCEKNISDLEGYWYDLFNSYQTQISQKEEITSLTHQLFQHPENWDRLKALVTPEH